MSQHWNRRWFVLDGSKLYYLKNDPSRQKMLICDVMLCTVKVRFRVPLAKVQVQIIIFERERRLNGCPCLKLRCMVSWTTC